MMSGHYSFTSCFAPFIESMITEKRNAGFQYEHAEWILHKFDELFSSYLILWFVFFLYIVAYHTCSLISLDTLNKIFF